MGFASLNFSEYGNSVQNILVSLEIEIPVYDVGLLCDSGLTARVAPPQCCAPVHGCPSPSALRLRPLSPSRACRLSAVPPCTAARTRAAFFADAVAVPPCTAAPDLSLRLALPVRCRPGARAF